MKFSRLLYLSESLQKKQAKVKWDLKYSPKKKHYYLVALANNNEILEVYYSTQLLQDYLRKENPFIVGIGDSYEEAIKIVEKIYSDSLSMRGDIDIKKFFAGCNN